MTGQEYSVLGMNTLSEKLSSALKPWDTFKKNKKNT